MTKLIALAVLLSTAALSQTVRSDVTPGLLTRTKIPVSQTQSDETSTTVTTLPSGTRVVMQLLSPLDTESAVSGSGVYLETLFPVICGNRVAIPAHTYVQGVIEAEKRAGHFDRVAAFRMRFTALVLANGYTLPIDGALQSLPGSSSARVRDKEGTVARTDQLDKALPAVAGGALTGAIMGSVRRFGIGTWRGAALGAGLGTGAVLITRGDSIHLLEGARVEMVLAESVSIQNEQIAEALKTRPGVTAVERESAPASPSDEQTPPRRSQRQQPAAPSLGGILERRLLPGILQ